MLLQTHAFLQALNGIVGVSLLYKIPLLMLITDRGSFGEKDPWQTEGGKYTRPVLDALHIAHADLRRPDEVQPKIDHAMTLAQASLSPVALLLQRRSEEHTSELQSLTNLVCRLLLEKKKTMK